ncbi:hypothetical protein ACTOB_002515 [Actinoplanes oblitus]|uniref:Sensor domain-containing protein n=1 Tax=Actinoplanes oblitus TaxID=3040509 RepID=A0ABY8WRG0_9ACTN|nr:hypothetical protein [Actinoplanes oblitus]WIM98894.1 hypothetical protein ACTOB_002515 [Actinoplanes oblitus]
MTDRTTLVIPAERVGDLDIPPVALDTGAADPEWVDWPLDRWGRRTPALRLPMSPRAARRARWRIRIQPYVAAVQWLGLAGLMVLLFWAPRGWDALRFASVGVSMLAVWLQPGPGVLPQMPCPQRGGGLRLNHVPADVVERWRAANPGLTDTREPAPRWYSRRFYALTGSGLILASILLGVLLTHDGRATPVWLATMVLLLFPAGIAVAMKVLPPGYIRFDRS